MIRIMKASAGSGKTYNLAKTYISLLLRNEDRYAYRHILAVTFTNKATEEMKSRIIKELHTLATEPSSSDYHDDFIPSLVPDDASMASRASALLHDILHDYGAFAVSTIDKFFQQTLKAFSREIGQFASYQVELDKDSLVAESVDRVLDSLTQDDTGLLSWLTKHAIEQIEKGGRYSPDANLLEMAKRLMSPQRQEELAIAGIVDQFNYSQSDLTEIMNACRLVIENFRNRVRDNAVAALNILRAGNVDLSASPYKFMNVLLTFEELGNCDKVEYPSTSFMDRVLDHKKWFTAANKSLLDKVYPDLEVPFAELHRLFAEEYRIYSTACILDEQLYGLGVASELYSSFKELMKEKNVLCIDDSNTILKGIIDNTETPFIYEKIGVRFDHFLLDEFQDTSSVQWDNFRALLKNSEAQGMENLIVGDVKQSIYRWRGSDWKLLDSVIPSLFPGFKPEVLDTNYRSLENIVEFNNAYFKAAAAVIDKMNGGDAYMTKLYSDVAQLVAKDDEPSGNVSLTFCSKEAHLQKFLESVEEARQKGARLSEIAVIVRTNKIGQKVASHLIENGIPVITDDSLKVKRSVTVRRLVSMMSLIDNPKDSVSGFMAESLQMDVPKGCTSLVDMVESFIRELKANDSEGVMDCEVLHVQSFVDHVHDYVASKGNNLRGFLKYWEDEDPSISSPSSGESVRVITIHKSKGLDFPYVIIPFAESIKMFEPDNRWCAPDLAGTPLEGVAEGVYDVKLSSSSANTLFAEHYETEKILQQVDNINTIYVAMTRAALGMHIIAEKPSSKCMENIGKEKNEGWKPNFSNFSQILYWFVSTGKMPGIHRTGDEEYVRFDLGQIVDFESMRKSDTSDVLTFPIGDGGQYPSYPLNADMSEEGDVRERGRLKFSADSLDFFAENGSTGVEASNRIRGVVLHDILAHVSVPEDIDGAVDNALMSGDLTQDDAQQVKELFRTRIAEVESRGWFPQDASKVMMETDIMDTDGQVYRPDRVVIMDGKTVVVDYKFGVHHSRYERQMKRYADILSRMGYPDVTACLWYVKTGEIKVI